MFRVTAELRFRCRTPGSIIAIKSVTFCSTGSALAKSPLKTVIAGRLALAFSAAACAVASRACQIAIAVVVVRPTTASSNGHCDAVSRHEALCNVPPAVSARLNRLPCGMATQVIGKIWPPCRSAAGSICKAPWRGWYRTPAPHEQSQRVMPTSMHGVRLRRSTTVDASAGTTPRICSSSAPREDATADAVMPRKQVIEQHAAGADVGSGVEWLAPDFTPARHRPTRDRGRFETGQRVRRFCQAHRGRAAIARRRNRAVWAYRCRPPENIHRRFNAAMQHKAAVRVVHRRRRTADHQRAAGAGGRAAVLSGRRSSTYRSALDQLEGEKRTAHRA